MENLQDLLTQRKLTQKTLDDTVIRVKYLKCRLEDLSNAGDIGFISYELGEIRSYIQDELIKANDICIKCFDQLDDIREELNEGIKL